MPTITLDKKKVLKLIGKKVSDKLLKDRISMLGTDLEKLDENEITVEIFPNRPDMLSEEGFSRALSAFMEIKPGFRKYSVKKEKSKVTVNNLPKEWPYAVCAIVRNLELDDEKLRSVIQLQEKLGVTLLRNRKKGGIGIYPLDKIELPITFTSYKKEKIKFRPLEHEEMLTADEILIKHPTGREYAHIVKGWKRFPVFTDAKGTIMSMPPIINSHDVGKVTEATKNVFVEGTGTDLNTLKIAMNIMLTTLADTGGTIYSLEMDYKTRKFPCPDLDPRKMKLDKSYANKLLGIELKDADIKKLLSKMGIGFEKGHALIPAYRADILHPIDLVEDIAIAYGYENFAEKIPKISTIGEESKEAIFAKKISDTAVGFSLLECLSYHLASKKHLADFMRKKDENIITTTNAVNIEYTALRNALLPGLLKILSENTHNEYPQKLFEVGKIIKPGRTSETNSCETLSCSVIIADIKAEFTEIKAILESILNSLAIAYTIKEASHPSYIDGRCAQILINQKPQGFLGEIHPQVLNNFNLEVPVSAFEIKFNETDYA